MNNVALVEGQPRTMGLKEMLQVWVGHRLDVTRRRSEHRLGSRRDRLHLVDGLLVAILDIDDVIQIIRSSEDTAEARERLMKAFDLSEIQSEYILELRLRRLTKFSRLEPRERKGAVARRDRRAWRRFSPRIAHCARWWARRWIPRQPSTARPAGPFCWQRRAR
ncbi:hypothetical protein GCM10025876_01360 [Demequina litorisediminis]|uniref:Topo IIA-type catalytic domain-containing protein n=1 Tax=Demequina litorisediminis TaxID=1849022 RepID=A0ABQ6I9Q4_9MICO|nr:hypothetical protein GCM10025876_01360 [Demequina litorisediminis]